MGLLNNVKGLGKKKKETTVNVTSQPQTAQSTSAPQQGQQSFDAKFIDGVNLRISNLENELSKVNVSMDGMKRNISEMNTELETLKENVKMVVSLYEMVSKKFNPFHGYLDETALTSCSCDGVSTFFLLLSPERSFSTLEISLNRLSTFPRTVFLPLQAPQ